MIKRIRVEDLEPGMFIADFNAPWLRHPFVPNRILLRDRRAIDKMRESGIAEVHIDTARGKDSPKAVPVEEANREIETRLRAEVAQPPDTAPESSPRVPFAAEFRRARQIYAEAKQEVRRQFDEVRSGRRVDGDGVKESVTAMIESIFRNREALLSLSRLKSFDEYTFHHSLNVAVLSLNLSFSLGILESELLRIGIGTVLHDLGKVRVPDGLIQKQGSLSPAEFEAVKSHTAHGAKLLLQARSVPADCAAVPLTHHERYDGSGYPRGLSGIGVGKFGLIAAIADVYDAMTSDRPYQKGMAPTQVLHKLYGWAGTYFHPIYVQRFIQCVGVYPMGSVVSLDTGEVGVVIQQNRGQLLRPWVRVGQRASGEPLAVPADVDLRDPDPAGEKPFARSVARVLETRQAGFDVAALLTLGARDLSDTASLSG